MNKAQDVLCYQIGAEVVAQQSIETISSGLS